jgi:tRNA(fMet)-specific endonuclease VapC
LLKGTYPHLTKKLISSKPSSIRISSIVAAELAAMARMLSDTEEEVRKIRGAMEWIAVADFDFNAAKAYGKLYSFAKKTNMEIGPYDIMIASVALANDATLITNNVKEFGRFSGLRVKDWTIEDLDDDD